MLASTADSAKLINPIYVLLMLFEILFKIGSALLFFVKLPLEIQFFEKLIVFIMFMGKTQHF